METDTQQPSDSRVDVSSSRVVRPPRRIWLQWHGDTIEGGDVEQSAVTWCQSKVWPHDIEYVQLPKDDDITPAGCLGRTASNLRNLASVQPNKKLSDDLRGFANEIELIATRTVA